MMVEADEQALRLQVGTRIRELRVAAGLTAVELAGRAGLSQGQLSKIETGKAALSISVLDTLCGILDRPLRYLFQKDTEIPRVLGTMTTVAGPEKAGVTWFSREVERRTGGRLSLVPLQATLLGSQTRQTAMLKEGVLDLFIEDLPAFRDLAPALDLLSLPYIFSYPEHQSLFLSSDGFRRRVISSLLRQGVHPIHTQWNWRRGVEWVILATRPIVHPDQVRGLKVRVYESSLLERFWEEMGAEPVVIPWPRVRREWLQGRFDLLPTHKAHLYPLGFCRRGRFVTRLGDVSPTLMVAMNQDRYSCLPPAIQAELVEACDRAGELFSREVLRAEEENEAANMRRFGAVYLQVDIRPWQSIARRITKSLLTKFPEAAALYADIQSLMEENNPHDR